MKLSQGHLKFVIGCGTRLGTTSVCTKEQMPEWPWSSRSLKDMFQGLRYPLTWSNGFCGGRGKRGVLVERGMGQRNIVIIIFWWIFWGREVEDKRRQKNGQTLFYFIFKNILFGHVFKKSTHSLFGAWSLLLVHIRSVYTCWGAQRLCKSVFQETRPWKSDHGIRQSSMVGIHGLWQWSRRFLGITGWDRS